MAFPCLAFGQRLRAHIAVAYPAAMRSRCERVGLSTSNDLRRLHIDRRGASRIDIDLQIPMGPQFEDFTRIPPFHAQSATFIEYGDKYANKTQKKSDYEALLTEMRKAHEYVCLGLDRARSPKWSESLRGSDVGVKACEHLRVYS
jgi:hypothetical protein